MAGAAYNVSVLTTEENNLNSMIDEGIFGSFVNLCKTCKNSDTLVLGGG